MSDSRSAWAAACLFAAVGVFASCVGWLDVLSAADLQYKLIGLAFAVAGLTLVAGSAILLRKRWWCTHGRVGAVAAGVAGALVGIYLLVMQLRAPALAPSRLPPFPAWVPWAGLVVASVVGAILGWWSTAEYADYQVKWTSIGGRLVAGGLSVTVLFAGVQWWYTQQYQPGTIAAALTVTTELKPAASDGDTSDPHLFEGAIKVRNVSNTKVLIVASLYQVTKVTRNARVHIQGVNDVDTERQAVACFLEELAPVTGPECDEPHIYEYGDFSAGDPRAQDDASISRTSRVSAHQTLQLGQIVSDGYWLEPKEEFQTNVLVHVPEEQPTQSQPPALRTLELSARLAVAQGSRLVLEQVPSHGPEMVPQALVSNEEYRDYEEAREDVQRDPQQVQGTADQAEEPDVTVYVDDAHRQAYYHGLTMPTQQNLGGPLGAPKPDKAPRPYPHRYTAAEWRIEDLSTIHRLVSGSQVVNTVQVLSMRLFDPVRATLTEVEGSDMVTCISPAGTLEDEKDESEIRRDPTAVCPGAWYSLAEDDGSVQSEYERQYQEMVDYREKMAAFYGLVLTEAGDVASLTTEAEAAAATIPASDHLHPVTSDVFRSCASAFGFAGAVTDFGDTLQQAFDRHASEMDVPTGRPVLDGAPSLHQGVEAADTLDSYLNEAQSWLDYCGSAGAFADGVVTGSGADHCLQTADAKSEALQHARDLGVEVREHHEVMLRYENGSITLSKALELGTPSLVAGAAAADAYRRAEDAADQLLKTCH